MASCWSLTHCNYFIYWLTNSERQVILEKCVSHDLLKKFPVFYAMRKLIAVFTKVRHFSPSWTRRIPSTTFRNVTLRPVTIPPTPTTTPVCYTFSFISFLFHGLAYEWHWKTSKRLKEVTWKQTCAPLVHVYPHARRHGAITKSWMFTNVFGENLAPVPLRGGWSGNYEKLFFFADTVVFILQYHLSGTKSYILIRSFIIDATIYSRRYYRRH